MKWIRRRRGRPRQFLQVEGHIVYILQGKQVFFEEAAVACCCHPLCRATFGSRTRDRCFYLKQIYQESRTLSASLADSYFQLSADAYIYLPTEMCTNSSRDSALGKYLGKWREYVNWPSSTETDTLQSLARLVSYLESALPADASEDVEADPGVSDLTVDEFRNRILHISNRLKHLLTYGRGHLCCPAVVQCLQYNLDTL